MAQISNNLIAGLLLVAIVISGVSLLTVANFGRVGVKLTGGASTGTGSANVTIGNSTDIILLRSVTNFGTGALGGAVRVLTTQSDNWDTFSDGAEGNGTAGYGAACTASTEVGCAMPFVVQNTGNINVSINISALAEAPSWIGTNAAAYFKGKNNETGACGMNFTGAEGFGEGPWTSLNTTERMICSSLEFSNSAGDEMRIHFNITVPSDAAGSKGVVITVGALAA